MRSGKSTASFLDRNKLENGGVRRLAQEHGNC